MCQLYQLIVTTQLLLFGGWVIPVQSQDRVSRPLSHSLPPQRVSVFGSQADGGCTSISNNICDGTSVLNDGIIPALSGVSDSPSSQWAAQLFTMTRSATEDIILTIEVDDVNHDCVELAVFNCPERGIFAPQVEVYLASSDGVSLMQIVNKSLTTTSCDYLLNFCIEFPVKTVSHYNLIFPYRNNSNSVFLGEVTFVNVDVDTACGPPELITSPVTLPPTATSESTTTESLYSTIPIDVNKTDIISLTTTGSITESDTDKTGSIITDRTLCDSCTVTALTVGVASAVITALLVAGISVAIHIAVYQCLYKPRLRSSTVAQGSTDQRDDVTGAGGGDAIVYDVIDERVGTALEMKQNEAYGLARSK